MKTKITQKLLNNLEPQDKPYRIHDTEQPGLFLRVQPTGHASYMVTWGRNREKSLGRVGKLTLAQARTEAARYLADAYEHGEPLAVIEGRTAATSPTLRSFIDDTYLPWFKAHHRGHQKTEHTLSTCFEPIMSRRLVDIYGRDLEQIRTSWLNSGNKPSTANRKMGSISGVLSRAVDWGYLESSPLDKVKALKVDAKGRIRYLSKDETKALRSALDAREERMRAERDSANDWRTARKQKPLADLRAVTFTDHLKPMVLLSLNTGLRRGELFSLKWHDVNLQAKNLTVAGEGTKTTETRHIPLNSEAQSTLEKWRKQHPRKSGYVFPGQDGERMTDVKTAWVELLKNAGVKDFRWHDMRHDFASRLVMAGVPLNTVRDLLGHSDIKMTLRYAHLAPDSKAAAVELI
ncbi:integrase [Pseudomonas sp. T]|nr:integrase [Pseudomonas sp. T]